MASALETLEAAVSRNTSTIASASALIAGLAEALREAADDPEQIAALAAELDAASDTLAAAVVANTPAEPAPAPEPDEQPAPDPEPAA